MKSCRTKKYLIASGICILLCAVLLLCAKVNFQQAEKQQQMAQEDLQSLTVQSYLNTRENFWLTTQREYAVLEKEISQLLPEKWEQAAPVKDDIPLSLWERGMSDKMTMRDIKTITDFENLLVQQMEKQNMLKQQMQMILQVMPESKVKFDFEDAYNAERDSRLSALLIQNIWAPLAYGSDAAAQARVENIYDLQILANEQVRTRMARILPDMISQLNHYIQKMEIIDQLYQKAQDGDEQSMQMLERLFYKNLTSSERERSPSLSFYFKEEDELMMDTLVEAWLQAKCTEIQYAVLYPDEPGGEYSIFADEIELLMRYYKFDDYLNLGTLLSEEQIAQFQDAAKNCAVIADSLRNGGSLQTGNLHNGFRNLHGTDSQTYRLHYTCGGVLGNEPMTISEAISNKTDTPFRVHYYSHGKPFLIKSGAKKYYFIDGYAFDYDPNSPEGKRIEIAYQKSLWLYNNYFEMDGKDYTGNAR